MNYNIKSINLKMEVNNNIFTFVSNTIEKSKIIIEGKKSGIISFNISKTDEISCFIIKHIKTILIKEIEKDIDLILEPGQEIIIVPTSQSKNYKILIKNIIFKENLYGNYFDFNWKKHLEYMKNIPNNYSKEIIYLDYIKNQYDQNSQSNNKSNININDKREIINNTITIEQRNLTNTNNLTNTTNSSNSTNLTNSKIPNIIFFSDKNTYWNKLEDFLNKYNNIKSNILSDPKLEYRYFCYKYLNYIKNIPLENELIDTNNTLKYSNSTVLIEFREYPHIEFTLRNMINKTNKSGFKWNHYVVCGKLNEQMVKSICKQINIQINIVVLDYDNIDTSVYSKILTSEDFWNNFSGDKILIYQEDSCIFNSNFDEFMGYDYIGAPWPKNQNDNINLVGNGGFSLRSKKSMIDVIKKISLEETKYNSSTLNYMKSANLKIPPEDVYFSLNMINHNIGKVAEWDVGYKFSTETSLNKESLGGHNFWLKDPEWKKRLYNKIIKQVRPNYDCSFLEHRGGWKWILESLNSNDFFDPSSDFDFYDIVEHKFLWNRNFEANKSWGGIIHCTHITPPHLNISNISNLFTNQKFIKSLEKCKFLICLSEYLTEYIKTKIPSIPIYTIKHPVIFDSIPMFDFELYLNNPNKKIIQIGQQLRKICSIYLLNIPEHKNIWLTGTKNFAKMNHFLSAEMGFLKLKNINMSKVEMKYTDTFEEYDLLLTKNIVLIDLYDASANNAVLECIARNTPFFVNKLPAVVEYVGDNYPLYFSKLDQIPEMFTKENLLLAHEYLKLMDKSEIKINNFIEKLYKIIDETL